MKQGIEILSHLGPWKSMALPMKMKVVWLDFLEISYILDLTK